MSLEDEFNIEIHDSDLTDENVTVQQIYDYIEKITA
jgi:acyl carrier protein